MTAHSSTHSSTNDSTNDPTNGHVVDPTNAPADSATDSAGMAPATFWERWGLAMLTAAFLPVLASVCFVRTQNVVTGLAVLDRDAAGRAVAVASLASGTGERLVGMPATLRIATGRELQGRIVSVDRPGMPGRTARAARPRSLDEQMRCGAGAHILLDPSSSQTGWSPGMKAQVSVVLGRRTVLSAISAGLHPAFASVHEPR